MLIGPDDACGYGVATVAGNLVAAGLSLALVDRMNLLGIAIAFLIGALITALLTGMRLRSKHGFAIPGSMLALVIFALASFSAVAALGLMTAELTLGGMGARALTGLIFVTGLWLILPAEVRADLTGELAARWQAWRGK